MIQAISGIKSYKAKWACEELNGEIFGCKATGERTDNSSYQISFLEDDTVYEEVWVQKDICSRNNNPEWECRYGTAAVLPIAPP